MANESSAPDAPDRKTGRVDRVGSDFGFILSEDVPNQAIYFKTSWFTFELKTFGDRLQAHNLARRGQEGEDALLATSPATRGTPATERLLEWRIWGTCRGLSLISHAWRSMNGGNSRTPRATQIVPSQSSTVTSFTRSAYALFIPSTDGRSPWRFSSFCLAGEGVDGQNLVRHFNPLPPLRTTLTTLPTSCTTRGLESRRWIGGTL
jgi:hypothetical protein